MLSPAALLASAVATAMLGAGPVMAHSPAIMHTAPIVHITPVAATSPAAQTIALSSSHCPKGHHKHCNHTREGGTGTEQLSEEETAVVGAALVALALAAL
jgi:hypothetical protein